MVDTVWTNPALTQAGGGLDAEVTEIVSAVTYDKLLSDINRLGGADGNTKTGDYVVNGVVRSVVGAPNGDAFFAKVSGDGTDRFRANGTGTLEWGPGNAGRDVNLYRSAADLLKTDDNLEVAGSVKLSGGLKVSGSPIGFSAGEVQFDNPGGSLEAGIATMSTGAPKICFDHRAASNTGEWRFRNGTNGGSLQGHLKGNGDLDIAGNLTGGKALLTTAEVPDTVTFGNARRYGIGVSVAKTVVFCHDAGDGITFGYYNGSVYTERARLSRIGGYYNTGAAFGTLSKRMIIPSTAWTPGSGSGALLFLNTDGSKDKYEIHYPDGTVFPVARCFASVPTNYGGQAIKVRIHWYATDGSPAIQWKLYAENTLTGSASGTSIQRAVGNFNGNGSGGSYTISEMDWSGSLPAAGDVLLLELGRQCNATEDTYAGIVRMRCVVLDWGI